MMRFTKYLLICISYFLGGPFNNDEKKSKNIYGYLHRLSQTLVIFIQQVYTAFSEHKTFALKDILYLEQSKVC